MDDKVNYAVVGAFVLALGAALVAAILWLAVGFGGQRKFDPYESIITESVAGLNLNAPVKYLGVNVGKVDRIEIDPRNSNQVLLRLLIEHGTPVKRDTEAVLESQGLTGIAYVELSGGSPQSPPLVATEPGAVPRIPSKPSLGTRAENVIGSVLVNLDRLANNLNATFDATNREALAGTLAGTRALVNALAAQQPLLRDALAAAAGAASQGSRAAEKLGPTLERIAASAQALERMADAAGDAGRAAGQTAEAATGAVRQLDTDTLPEMHRALAELSAAAGSMRRLAERLDREPQALVRGAPLPPPGPGEKVTP